MQSAKAKTEAQGRKAKLAHSYQELLDEFADQELRSVGNYTLGRLIGKGSFGKVYLATHKLTNGSKVVLKSANKGDSNLAREIHHHRQFVHPHIARLYEVIVTETLVWMVLEYCPGDELYNYLLKHGKLPVDKVQKIFAQLVGAVCYVHQQSCVHRDLKLENILFDKHEDVKLCDFGFTREYEGKANYLQTFCGTVCYSAPEMLKGERYAGEKVDVWSLGVILYALLTGELPFDDDDDAVTRAKILRDEPAYPDHIPADALALLRALLSKRPLRRPALPDILAHPFLADHAPRQQAILARPRPAPFSTPLETDTLHRLRSAGVDIDAVIESVLAQRCDALAGWWTLLIEKEERKAARRERKRREREAENRLSRRLSQASGRLERLATVGEEAAGGASSSSFQLSDPPAPRTRGRSERRRSGGHYLAASGAHLSPDAETTTTTPPPPPVDKDSIRSASSSRHRRPIPPPKEGILRSARSRGSTLHLVTTSDALAAAAAAAGAGAAAGGGAGTATTAQNNNSRDAVAPPRPKMRKKPSQTIVAHWKNWTHWLFENARRHKGSGKRAGSQSTPNLVDKNGGSSRDGGSGGKSKDTTPRPQTSRYPAASSSTAATATPPPPSSSLLPAAPSSALPRGVVANGFVGKAGAPLGSHMNANDNSSAPSTSLSTPTQPHAPQLPRMRTDLPPYHATSNSNNSSNNNTKRQSLSPSPLTPRSTVRRSSGSAGLRGRKSTSSSVSSVRSMHHAHHHSHSKASSTSSNGSVSTSLSKSHLPPASRSPHHSIKILPATPTAAGFPSNIRLVRDRTGPPLSIFNEGMPGFLDRGAGRHHHQHPQPPGSPSPFHSFGSAAAGHGVLFAKRKRNLFKGPMLSLGGGGGGGGSREGRSGSESGSAGHSRSASASNGPGRRSGEITIEEVDEDAAEEVVEEEEEVYDEEGEDQGYEDVEEVEAFSPVVSGPGEVVEEKIYDDGDGDGDGIEPQEVAPTGKGKEVAAAREVGADKA